MWGGWARMNNATSGIYSCGESGQCQNSPGNLTGNRRQRDCVVVSPKRIVNRHTLTARANARWDRHGYRRVQHATPTTCSHGMHFFNLQSMIPLVLHLLESTINLQQRRGQRRYNAPRLPAAGCTLARPERNRTICGQSHAVPRTSAGLRRRAVQSDAHRRYRTRGCR